MMMGAARRSISGLLSQFRFPTPSMTLLPGESYLSLPSHGNWKGKPRLSPHIDHPGADSELILLKPIPEISLHRQRDQADDHLPLLLPSSSSVTLDKRMECRRKAGG